MTQDEPLYNLRITKYPGLPCVECNRSTGDGVVGHRNDKPLCDRCLAEQEPRLALTLAIQAGVLELADAARVARPQGSTAMLELLGEHARDLRSYFSKRWRDLWGACAESRRSMTYDLVQVQRRALAAGGPKAAAFFENPRWVKRNIREAKRNQVNVKDSLFIAALRAAGKELEDDKQVSHLLDDDRDDSTLLFQLS